MRLWLTLVFLMFVFVLSGQSKNAEYWNLAVKYTESGSYEEAVKICDKLLAEDPGVADVFYLRGVNKYLLKDYEGAITDFDKTIELDPNFTDAYLKRARAKKEMNNYLGALRDYNQAKNENFAQTVTSLAGELIRSLFSGD